MKKFICLLIVFSLIIPTGISAFAADLEWPYIADTAMPFGPADNYRSMNNPPSFRWPRVEGATYEIKVCTDKELTNIVLQKTGTAYNVYNFNVAISDFWNFNFKQFFYKCWIGTSNLDNCTAIIITNMTNKNFNLIANTEIIFW